MKILGIDTSTKFMCIGLYDGAKIYEYNLEVGRLLSGLLNVTIKRVLDAAGLDAGRIDYFACGLGPGSFTGMRIGISYIKGLSWALKKPVVGISTLDILAYELKQEAGPIIPIIDAKRGLVYCAIFKRERGRLTRIKPYLLINEKELLKKIRPKSIILGDGIQLYREQILKTVPQVKFLESEFWYPKAHNIIELAMEKIAEKKISDTFRIKPIYLYPKECQIK